VKLKISDRFKKYAGTIELFYPVFDVPFKRNNEVVHDPRAMWCDGDFDFPIAIVENKPVFVGDELFHPGSADIVNVVRLNSSGILEVSTSDRGAIHDFPKNYTWTKSDEYQIFRNAEKNGKRLAFESRTGDWGYIPNPTFNHPAERYKIVDDDAWQAFEMHSDSVGEFKIKAVKCALTGKITVEVIE
jgi:hypothetical protein